MPTELVGAMNVLVAMGRGDTPMTPNDVLNALSAVPGSAGFTAGVGGRLAPNAAERYTGEGMQTTTVSTPRSDALSRFDEHWLELLANYQGDYITEHTAGRRHPRDYAIASLRYALDKAGLTLVPR